MDKLMTSYYVAYIVFLSLSSIHLAMSLWTAWKNTHSSRRKKRNKRK